MSDMLSLVVIPIRDMTAFKSSHDKLKHIGHFILPSDSIGCNFRMQESSNKVW